MKVLVTAGPTREAIDPVRFISNRSSGKMGYAVASVAVERGHEVRLVSGPVTLSVPDRLSLFNVVSSREMLDAVQSNVEWCDVLIMVAAVADWRPRRISLEKIKKTGADSLTLEFERTADILASLKAEKGKRMFVGFAAESGNPVDEACRKMSDKGLDLIVANDISRSDSGFSVDSNQVFFVDKSGVIELPLLSKREVAGRILDWLDEHCREVKSL